MIQAVCRRLRALDSSCDVSQVKTFFDWYKELSGPELGKIKWIS